MSTATIAIRHFGGQHCELQIECACGVANQRMTSACCDRLKGSYLDKEWYERKLHCLFSDVSKEKQPLHASDVHVHQLGEFS